MIKLNEIKLNKEEEIYVLWTLGNIGRKIGKEMDLYFSENSFMNLSRNNIAAIYRDPQNRFAPTSTEDLPNNAFLETYVEVTVGQNPGTFRYLSISYISYYDARRKRVIRIAEERFDADRNEYPLSQLEEKVKAAVAKTDITLFSSVLGKY